MPYNVMCSASGQVINAGNPCRAVALVRQSSWKPVEIVHRDKTLEVFGPGDHNTHPGSNWSPGSAHFPRAPYNEYGGLYLDVDYGTDDEWAERWLMVKSILAGMPDVLPGDNTVHDIGFVKSEFF